WDIVTAVSPDILIYTPLYAFILAIFLMIVQFPLGFYSSFVYEHKYNLSNYKLKGWFVDFLKETLISLIFFIPAITVLYYLIIFTPLWWLYAGIIYAVVATILDFMLPVILLPFFYKIEPYKNEKQKKKLLDMVRRAGISNIKTVLVANESEKSKKPNAMFAGFGHTKRIVLFDTLINYFTQDETETVIGHELGHYVNKDSMKGILIDIILIFPILYIISLILSPVIVSFIPIVATLPLFLLLYEIIELIIMPFINTYSRHVERKADIFALDISRKPDAQISTEKRLADMALGDDSPHPFVEFMFFTHPAIRKRIQSCLDWKKEHKR
ncbi:MAG: M48 family metalloprotease, partial [Candidatus Aenigmatarchaeota archaeon]